MRQLDAARGTEFDRLYLQGMIPHHEGALAMVAQLYASPAAASNRTSPGSPTTLTRVNASRLPACKLCCTRSPPVNPDDALIARLFGSVTAVSPPRHRRPLTLPARGPCARRTPPTRAPTSRPDSTTPASPRKDWSSSRTATKPTCSMPDTPVGLTYANSDLAFGGTLRLSGQFQRLRDLGYRESAAIR